MQIKDINWLSTPEFSWCGVLYSILVAHHCLYGLHVYVDYIFCLRKSLTLCSLSRQAPSSLLEALEQHLASLEGKKVKDSTAASRYINPLVFALDHSNYLNIYIRSVILTYLCCTASGVNLFPCRASTLSNAVSSLASTGMSFTKVDEREKQAALEEEQARLKALKVNAFLKRKMKHYFTWHALNLPSVGFFLTGLHYSSGTKA